LDQGASLPRATRRARWRRLGGVTSLVLASLPAADAAILTWVGGNNNWIDGESIANWSPADEPDSDDVAVFNTANQVNLGGGNLVAGLTLGAGIDLFTLTHFLDVNGDISLGGASTSLNVGGNNLAGLPANGLDAANIVINSGATLSLGGTRIDYLAAAGEGLLDINAGGTFSGNGTLQNLDGIAAATSVLTNDGTLSVANFSTGFVVIGGTPAARTLVIGANDVDARIDLDGSTGLGSVNVFRNQTLDLDVALSDPFSGTLNLFQESTVDSASPWSLDGGSTVTVDNGFVPGNILFPDIPAGTAYLAGAAITQTGGTIDLVDGDGTLRFDAPFTMTGGNLINNGRLVVSGGTVGPASNLTMPSDSSGITVLPGATFTVNQTAFNPDGNGTAGNLLTLGDGSRLNLNLGAGSDLSLGGTIQLGGSILSVTTSTDTWTINRSIQSIAGTGASTVAGDPLTLDNASVSVAAGSSLSFDLTPLTVGPGCSFTGDGTLRFGSTSLISANAAVGTAVFDWDGIGSGTLHTIQNGAVFTISSPVFDTDGDMDDPISLGGDNAALAVNGPATWTMNRTFTANSAGSGTAQINGSSTLRFAGVQAILNVNGNTTANARLEFDPSSVVNLASGAGLRLSGGTLGNPNTIDAATISGLGTLQCDPSSALEGQGTINSTIDFDGAATLRAAGGVLSLGGTIADAGTLGTNQGVLNVTGAWTTSVADTVDLNGGELSGGTVTIANSNGITGNGTLSARVINGTRIRAQGGTLVVETAAHDNDWDGAGNTGLLAAAAGTTLELRDTLTFGFSGAISALSGATVATNGFGFDLNPGSSLSLTGARYQSTHSTDFQGTITVHPGADSSIEIEVNRFLDIESTCAVTLNGNLRLVSNNAIIGSGATFSGSGALVVPAASNLVTNGNANVGVLLDLHGTLRPGGFDLMGRLDLPDYQQSSTATLFSEIAGTGLNQFDRLVINGAAQLDGVLVLDIDDGFVPTAGQSFNIISAVAGISGKFIGATTVGMPAGHVLEVNYLPNIVQVLVVAGTHYDYWIQSFPSLVNPTDRLKTADPDGDGLSNLLEFALNGNPTKGGPAKQYGKIAPVGGVDALTLTLPVRFGSYEFPPVQPPGELILLEPDDNMSYHIQASDTLDGFTVEVTEVTGADAAAIQAGLPPLDSGWVYRTFRSEGPVAGDPSEYMRVEITD
jgi:hypothetical protein